MSGSVNRISPTMGIEEFVDLDLDDFERRSRERVIDKIEQVRERIEAELGEPFEVVQSSGRLLLVVGEQTKFIASTSPRGRLIVTDVSGRFSGRL